MVQNLIVFLQKKLSSRLHKFLNGLLFFLVLMIYCKTSNFPLVSFDSSRNLKVLSLSLLLLFDRLLLSRVFEFTCKTVTQKWTLGNGVDGIWLSNSTKSASAVNVLNKTHPCQKLPCFLFYLQNTPCFKEPMR